MSEGKTKVKENTVKGLKKGGSEGWRERAERERRRGRREDGRREKGEVLGFKWGFKKTLRQITGEQSLLEELLLAGQTDREAWWGNEGSSSPSASDRWWHRGGLQREIGAWQR